MSIDHPRGCQKIWPGSSGVAALRLLGARDDLVQLRLVLRDDAVDALEHLVLLVAAVVAAGDAGELDDADLLRVRDVRTAAHLHVVADGVGRDVLALGDVAEALELVLLAREHLRALVARDDLPDERLVERDQARDLGLDLREVLRRKAVRQVEVVVEPLVRRRADVDLHVLEHVLHRARHQVRRGMPPHLKCSFCHCLSLNPCRSVYYTKNGGVAAQRRGERPSPKPPNWLLRIPAPTRRFRRAAAPRRRAQAEDRREKRLPRGTPSSAPGMPPRGKSVRRFAARWAIGLEVVDDGAP